MINKAISLIEPADIDELVSTGTEESQTLDFKQQLHDASDKGKHDLCADISAMANAAGGYLVFGIREIKGVAASIEDIKSSNPDADILRLEQTIHSGTSPSVPGLSFKHLKSNCGKSVVILHIPKSWNGPHLAKSGKGYRMYTRTSKGNRPLDGNEIRQQYILSQSVTAEIRNWRSRRIADILAQQAPIVLPKQAMLVLHAVPYQSISSPLALTASELKAKPTAFAPLGVSGWNNRINLDGYLTFGANRYQTDSQTPHTSYCQVFRSGAVETVYAEIVRKPYDKPVIASQWYEMAVLESVANYLDALGSLGINYPISIMVSLLNAKGAYMGLDRSLDSESDMIDRDVILFPEVLIEEPPQNLPSTLRPLFDSVWNACGLTRSLNYDQNGKWVKAKLPSVVPNS